MIALPNTCTSFALSVTVSTAAVDHSPSTSSPTGTTTQPSDTSNKPLPLTPFDTVSWRVPSAAEFDTRNPINITPAGTVALSSNSVNALVSMPLLLLHHV